MSNLPPFEQPGIRRFWPNFVVAAVLTPLMWILLEGLAQPDNVVGFYIVSISAIPIVFAIVLLPAWRLFRKEESIAVRAAIPILALPSLAIVLWGIYTALWLAHILLVFD